MTSQLLIALGGLAAVITALAGAYVALSKRRPEVARVFIESAGELVVAQSSVLKETQASHAALQKRVEQLESRSREHERLQKVATAEVEDLHRELSSMHEEVAKLTESRDKARADLENAKTEVQRLQARVQLLEETLAAHNIPTPDITNGDGP